MEKRTRDHPSVGSVGVLCARREEMIRKRRAEGLATILLTGNSAPRRSPRYRFSVMLALSAMYPTIRLISRPRLISRTKRYSLLGSGLVGLFFGILLSKGS